MVDQQIFNIAVALVGALGGWWMNTMWQSLKDLQKADKELADKVAAPELLDADTLALIRNSNRLINGDMRNSAANWTANQSLALTGGFSAEIS